MRADVGQEHLSAISMQVGHGPDSERYPRSEVGTTLFEPDFLPWPMEHIGPAVIEQT